MVGLLDPEPETDKERRTLPQLVDAAAIQLINQLMELVIQANPEQGKTLIEETLAEAVPNTNPASYYAYVISALLKIATVLCVPETGNTDPCLLSPAELIQIALLAKTTSITSLKDNGGIGTRDAQTLKRLGILTLEFFLYNDPRVLLSDANRFGGKSVGDITIVCKKLRVADYQSQSIADKTNFPLFSLNIDTQLKVALNKLGIFTVGQLGLYSQEQLVADLKSECVWPDPSTVDWINVYVERLYEEIETLLEN